MPRLLVIVPDKISDILSKGEHQPCYYNPGNLSDDVHILMMNDDQPDKALLQGMVGTARLTLHNYPDDLSLPLQRPGFLRGHRLRRWAKDGVGMPRAIAPDFIRCHSADWNAYLASRIKAKLGIPYVVSLHTNPDAASVRRWLGSDLTEDQKTHNAFYDYLEGEGLRRADLAMPVYQSILPYLKRLRVKRIEVCYNILDGSSLRRKESYELHRPAELVYVSRLIDGKEPDNIIRAVAALPETRLTIIGDGSKRASLEALVASLGVGDRVIFEPSVPNDELCRRLAEFDIFVVHSDYWEISKSVLEGLLTGLPCIINRRPGDPVPELQGDFVRLVDNTAEGYRAALADLLSNSAARAGLGRHAYEHANALWSPASAESKVVAIYKRLLKENGYA